MSFVKQHLAKVILVIALMCAFALPATAQELKIGVVNVPLLMDRAPQTKAAMDALQEEFAPRQREFAAKAKELEDFTAKVQKDAAVMGETERRNAEKDLRDLQREVARLQNEFQEDLNLRQNEELGNLQRTLLVEVQKYAQDQGYDLVVGDGVLFASTAVNITAEVLQAVETTYNATSSR
ncbi:MAG: OmpH family outer membrane protein [Gammaproteobacteria bacterium]|nr:OmpH family outer membrane protein [Gammaproteobacteria bacterium]